MPGSWAMSGVCVLMNIYIEKNCLKLIKVGLKCETEHTNNTLKLWLRLIWRVGVSGIKGNVRFLTLFHSFSVNFVNTIVVL